MALSSSGQVRRDHRYEVCEFECEMLVLLSIYYLVYYYYRRKLGFGDKWFLVSGLGKKPEMIFLIMLCCRSFIGCFLNKLLSFVINSHTIISLVLLFHFPFLHLLRTYYLFSWKFYFCYLLYIFLPFGNQVYWTNKKCMHVCI